MAVLALNFIKHNGAKVLLNCIAVAVEKAHHLILKTYCKIQQGVDDGGFKKVTPGPSSN